MTFADVVGSVGVALLLVAFALNLTGRLGRDDRTYHGINAVGAGLACAASLMIAFYPFVILEGAWCAVALAALMGGRSAGGAEDAGTGTR